MKNILKQYPLIWEILPITNNSNSSTITRKTGATYAHVLKLLNELKESKIIEVKPGRDKREKRIVFTEKGELLNHKIEEIKKLLREE